MIDTHCHILPGIDDGAADFDASIVMAKKAVKQGITTILCTPHHNNGRYTNPKQQVIQVVDELQALLDEQGIPLDLIEGQEVRLTSTLIDEIKQGNILFTDEGERYILIEFPTADIPEYTEQLFAQLRTLKKVPVIVHPERNIKLIEDPNRLLTFLDMGCLAQLTAPSYVGIYGKRVQKIAEQMVDHHMVQFIASDAHGPQKRDFYLKEAYKKLKKEHGETAVERFQRNVENLVDGKKIMRLDYSPVEKKRFLFFN